jgi:hypothetical protein
MTPRNKIFLEDKDGLIFGDAIRRIEEMSMFRVGVLTETGRRVVIRFESPEAAELGVSMLLGQSQSPCI